MLISVELQVFANQLVYDQIFIGKFGSVWGSVVQSAEYFCSYLCPHLREHTPFFKGLFKHFFKFVYGSHLNVNYFIIIELNLLYTQKKNLQQNCTSQMALHSAYDKSINCKIACGFPILPFKTKFDGPGNLPFQAINDKDIIDEAFQFFRINVLFKNFEINGPGDKVLVYLLVLISHLFKVTENIKEASQAQKRLSQIAGLKVPLPKQKSNFISMMLDDGNGPERQQYCNYTTQLRNETIRRFLDRFYKDGLPIEDFKFWSGPAKKKFMGLNFVSLF